MIATCKAYFPNFRNNLKYGLKSFGLTAIFFGICMHSLQAQEIDYNKRMQEAFGDLLELRHERMQEAIAMERRSNSSNVVPDFLESSQILLTLLINEDTQALDKHEPLIKSAISRIESVEEETPFKKHLAAELYLGLAAVHGRYGNNLQAGWNIWKGYRRLKNNYKEHPGFTPTHVPMGVFYAVIGSLPKKYQSIASLFGFEADTDKGFYLMRTGYWRTAAHPEWQFLKPYYGIIYSYINLQLTGEGNVSPEKLKLDVENSALIIYVQSKIYSEKGQNRQAYELLKKRRASTEYTQYPFFDYHTGKAGIPFNRAEAEQYFTAYVKQQTNRNFIKSSYRYLCWIHLLRDNKRQAMRMRDSVLNTGQTAADDDKQAQAEMQRPLNEKLIRARLAFDASNYSQTLEILTPASFPASYGSNIEKAEYHYRRGRALQRLEREDSALTAYERALQLETDEANIMQGNAALQAAIICVKRDEDDRAKRYFERCLEIENYAFFEGIHQRAKIGLENLKN